MEFSQSFEFGNSTFMKLESQANHAIKDDKENCEPSNENGLDVILESPPKSNNRTSAFSSASRSRSRFLQNATQRNNQRANMDTTHHRKFRRSKSDSTLPKAPKDTETCENYSEFFRSDFSINNDNVKEDGDAANVKEDSYLRVSQIEAAFSGIDPIPENKMEESPIQEVLFTPKENNEYDESSVLRVSKIDGIEKKDNISNGSYNVGELDNSEDGDNNFSFDKPIFSEDLKDLIYTEDPMDDDNADADLWKDTLPLTAPPKESDKCEEPIEASHEISSFLCHPQEDVANDERKQLINKELESSHKIFKQCQQAQDNVSQGNISLSLMSPEQLKFTQDSTPLADVKSMEPNKAKSVYEKQTIKAAVDKKPANKKVIPDATETENKQKIKLSNNLEELKSISAWNLPLSILKEYERKGVRKMFDWQIQCLSNPKVRRYILHFTIIQRNIQA